MTLLLGATGYIGRAFAAELRKRGVAFTPMTRQALDYTRFEILFDSIHKLKPAFVINAAGYIGKPVVEGCERSRSEAVQANTLLPQTLARVCYLTKTPWGHISSGSIYSGAKISDNGTLKTERDLSQPDVRKLFESHPEKFRGFIEADEPNCSFRSPPCSFYSGTKALAEESLRWTDQCYVWRPQTVFDEFDHPRNYLSQLQAAERSRDELNSFTHRGDFVRACLDLWERRAPYGAYNIVNPGAATTQHIAAAIGQILETNRKIDLSAGNGESGPKALRSQSILDTSKLISAGVRMRPLREALEDSLKKWQPTPQNDGWPGTSTASA